MSWWWLTSSALVLAACAGEPPSPAHAPEPLVEIRASSPAEPAVPMPAPARATPPAAIPPPEGDPKACMDRPPAHETWELELGRRVDTMLAKLATCTRGLPASGTVALAMGFEQDGKGSGVSVFQGTLDACPAVDCLKRGLEGVGALPVPANKEPSYKLKVRLTPGHAPHRTDEALASGSTQHCVTATNGTDGDAKRLPPEVIQQRIREQYDRIRACYDRGRRRDPTLKGRVTVRFVIGRDGRVMFANVLDNTLPDCSVAACVRDEIRATTFPKPEGGVVTIVYPLMLGPD